MHPSTTASSTAPHNDIGLLSLFQGGSKATMDINGVLQKGYIQQQANKTYHFSVRHSPRSPTEIWGVPLHEFEQHWDKLMTDETLFPGHNPVSSFLRTSRSLHQHRALFVSDRSLVRNCPASLTAAIHGNHPDRGTWLQSYQEDKQSLHDHSIYTVIYQ